MAKYIHNMTEGTLYFMGVETLAGDAYLIPASKEVAFQSNDAIIGYLANGQAKMSPDGVNLVSGGASDQLNFLRVDVLVKTTAFSDPEGVEFDGQGFSGTALSLATTDIDFQMPQTLRMNGINVMCASPSAGDKVTLQVVDKDNVLGYGAGVVLKTFASNWFVDWNNGHNIVQTPYYATVYQGLYVRVKYTNAGVSPQLVYCNLYCHKEIV